MYSAINVKVFGNEWVYYVQNAIYFLSYIISIFVYFQVLPCDILTRVSQYVPENVTYIQKIIENGYA